MRNCARAQSYAQRIKYGHRDCYVAWNQSPCYNAAPALPSALSSDFGGDLER